MKKKALASTIDRSAIGPDTPLRLEVAAVIAYPDESINANGLRGLIRSFAGGSSWRSVCFCHRLPFRCGRFARPLLQELSRLIL
jgi:hypothetical protein